MKARLALVAMIIAAACAFPFGARAQLVTTIPPNYLINETNLVTGFSPDPTSYGVGAGGAYSAGTLGASDPTGGPCRGYFPYASQRQVNYTTSISATGSNALPLRFFVEAQTDATMLVLLPNGTWRCSDDANVLGYAGLNPLIDIASPTSGRYNVWIGTYSSFATTQPATLYVTESIANVPGGNTGAGLPSNLTVSPATVILGKPLTLTVAMAERHTTATAFRVLSDLGTALDISIPAGQTTASVVHSLPPMIAWQYIRFCVTPDVVRETRFPCIHSASKSASAAPYDQATVLITSLKINGDSGTGKAVLPRGKTAVLEVNLNAIVPMGNITMQSTAFSYNKLIYATNTFRATDAPFLDSRLAFGGKTGVGVISAELGGRTVTRDIEIPPLVQIEKTCFFDPKPTAGWWSSTFDYCTHEITPGTVTGGQEASGFVRRGFGSFEPVYVELSSSDPSIATVTPASATIGGQQRGMQFLVKTVATGGTAKTVTINVREGGTHPSSIALTVK